MGDGTGRVEDLLIVDDNPADIRFIEEAIDASGLNPAIHSTTSGDEALDFAYQRGEYADAPEPDVVFLDWNLPRKTGSRVLEDIKAVYPHIPVVAMTGSESETDAIRSANPGADMYLVKPTDPAGYVEALCSIH